MSTLLDTARNDSPGAEAHGCRPDAISPAGSCRPESRWAVVRLATDAAMLVLACGAAALTGRAGHMSVAPVSWLLVFAGLALLLYRISGLYAPTLRLRTIDDLRAILIATTAAAMVVLAVRHVIGASRELTAETVRLWAFALVYVGTGRLLLYWTRQRARTRGEGLRRTLIVGAGRIGERTAARLVSAPELGLRPVAFLDGDPLVATAESVGIPVLGAVDDLDRVLDAERIDHVIITFSNESDDRLLGVLHRCEEHGTTVSVVPRLFERMPEEFSIEYLGGLPLITPLPTDPRGWQYRVKYGIDRVVAAIALILVSPLLLVLAGAVVVSLGRPIFFRQVRVGRDGRPFEMLKFRSMREGRTAAPQLRVVRASGLGPGGIEGDDRRTRVGAILRRTSLDELAQLLNVLKGDMSIVGPRPERPEFVSEFAQTVHRYDERHRVKAGITGWAQVHGLRGKTSLADRAEWDNFYIENFSLWLDFKIMLRTVGAVIGSFRHVE